MTAVKGTSIQRRLLDAGSSTRNLSVLLSAMEKSCTTRAALALVRDRRQNCLRTCAVTRVAAATTRGLGLVEDIW